MKSSIAIAMEIARRNRMKNSDAQQDFLSSESDDSGMTFDNEDFLSSDMEAPEPKEENVPSSDGVSVGDIIKRVKARQKLSK